MNQRTSALICDRCSQPLQGTVLQVISEVQRIDFAADSTFEGDGIDHAEGVPIASYCSADCLSSSLDRLMEDEEGFAMPRHAPGTDPIEVCAMCLGPVDISAWHQTYFVREAELVESIYEIAEASYIAVLCRRCTGSFVSEDEAGEGGDSNG